MVCVSSGPEGQVQALSYRRHLRGQCLFLVTMGCLGLELGQGPTMGWTPPSSHSLPSGGGDSLPSVMHKLPPAQGPRREAEARGALGRDRGDPPKE